MRNPWLDLPTTAPFEHARDSDALYETYNHLPSVKRPQTGILPNPYVGNPAEASVILLTKVPLFSPENIEQCRDIPEYHEAYRKNLTFENTEYPFFFLDPRFRETAGNALWLPKLVRLIDDVGLDVVATKVAAISYFPYHMDNYRPAAKPLFTQKYSFDLVRDARDAGKVIVAMTFASEWKKEIARLNPLQWRGQSLTSTPAAPDSSYGIIVRALGGPRDKSKPAVEEVCSPIISEIDAEATVTV